MKTKLHFILLLAFCCSGINGQAQESYGFSKFNSTYNYLSNPTPVTTVSWNSGNTEIVPDIGFTFNFFDTAFTKLYISGGWIQFYYYSDYSIEAFRAPINGNGYQNRLSYETSGNPGSRIFKLEWRNANFTNGYGGDSLNAQLWLYEGSDVIEVYIGPTNVQQNWAAYYGYGPGIGVSSPTEKIGLFGPADDPCVMVNSPYSFGVDSTPSDGMAYRFTPGGTTSNYCNASSKKEEPVLENIITISPNISSGIFFITLPFQNNNFKNIATVYNILGTVVGHFEIRTLQYELDLSGQPGGIYFLQVDQNGTIYHIPFIIE